MLFKKKINIKTFDQTNEKPVIRASICTGERTAGFQDNHTGKFTEVMLIRNDKDLSDFKKAYGITEDIETFYQKTLDQVLYATCKGDRV